MSCGVKCQRNVCLENPGCLNCESRLCVSCPAVSGRVSQRSSFPGLHQLIWWHLNSFCRDPWSLHHVLFSLLCCWRRTNFIHTMGEKWRLGQNEICCCLLSFFLSCWSDILYQSTQMSFSKETWPSAVGQKLHRPQREGAENSPQESLLILFRSKGLIQKRRWWLLVLNDAVAEIRFISIEMVCESHYHFSVECIWDKRLSILHVDWYNIIRIILVRFSIMLLIWLYSFSSRLA